MNRETLNYISRRVREENRSEPQNRDYENRQNNSEYEEHSISGRYGNSTNTYRAEGTIEGRIEHHEHSGDDRSKRQIGFNSNGMRGDQDMLYKLEESFEEEIGDIVYYSELAMEAHTKGHTEFAQGFYEIAKEKLACAEYLRHKLINHGKYDPSKQSEIEDRFDRAKHLFRRL